jgi:hypothetical protein
MFLCGSDVEVLWRNVDPALSGHVSIATAGGLLHERFCGWI